MQEKEEEEELITRTTVREVVPYDVFSGITHRHGRRRTPVLLFRRAATKSVVVVVVVLLRPVFVFSGDRIVDQYFSVPHHPTTPTKSTKSEYEYEYESAGRH